MPKYKQPRLYDAGGDVSKMWYVYYFYLIPGKSEFEPHAFQMFKITKGMNRIKKLRPRRIFANDLLEALSENLRHGYSPFGDNIDQYHNMLLSEALEKILLVAQPGLRPRSFETYKTTVKIFNGFLAKRYPKIYATELSEEVAVEFGDYVLHTLKHSGKSHNKYKQLLSSLFNRMRSRSSVLKKGINPFAAIKKLPEETRSNLAYTKSEVQEIKKYCLENDRKIWFVFQLIYYALIRPNEIRQLRISDIDFDLNVIKVSNLISKVGRHRSVYIHKDFLPVLKAHCQGYPVNFFIVGVGFAPSAKMIGRNHLGNHFRKLHEELSLHPDHSLYSFKHTGVVAALRAGIDPVSIMMQAGLKRLETFMVYARSIGYTPLEAFDKAESI